MWQEAERDTPTPKTDKLPMHFICTKYVQHEAVLTPSPPPPLLDPSKRAHYVGLHIISCSNTHKSYYELCLGSVMSNKSSKVTVKECTFCAWCNASAMTAIVSVKHESHKKRSYIYLFSVGETNQGQVVFSFQMIYLELKPDQKKCTILKSPIC